MKDTTYLYVTNKKYFTASDNLVAAATDLFTHYSSSPNKRDLVLVTSADGATVTASYQDALGENVYSNLPSGVSADMLTLKAFNEVDDISYLMNDDKAFMVFVDDREYYTVYFKYIQALLASIGLGTVEIVKDFALKVLGRELLLTSRNHLTEDYINGIVDDMFTSSNLYASGTIFESRHWSYDILLYLEDNIPDNSVSLPYLRSKFAIHKDTLMEELLGSIISRNHQISPLLGLADYLEVNGSSINRTTLINSVWKSNEVTALYYLDAMIKEINNNSTLVTLITNHNDWAYKDVVEDLTHMLPIVVKMVEGGYTLASGAELRSLWSEVEFFTRRANRIPYLQWTVQPI